MYACRCQNNNKIIYLSCIIYSLHVIHVDDSCQNKNKIMYLSWIIYSLHVIHVDDRCQNKINHLSWIMYI